MGAAVYVLLACVAFLSAVGLGMFVYAGRPSRVAAAREAGESEESIQEHLAMIRKMRNVFAVALVLAVAGAIVLSLANSSSTS